MSKTAEDYFAVLDDMSTVERFLFGVKLLSYRAKDYFTKRDEMGHFLETATQQYITGKNPSSDIVVKQITEIHSPMLPPPDQNLS